MRGGVLLIIIALFIIYLGVSGKFCCFSQFLTCALSNSLEPCKCGQGDKQVATTSNLLPALPALPSLPSLPSLTTLG